MSPAAMAVDRLRTALRMRLSVRRYALRVLDALGRAPVAGDPGQRFAIRSEHVGPDPLRVLLFGGGLAVGYGVTRRQDAVDQPLADGLGAALGRGVAVDNRAVPHVRLPDVAATLGATGTHTYDVAIWCPSFIDGIERTRPASWRNLLHRMIADLRGEERTPLLLTHMPVPAGRHPAALIARPWVHRLNRIIDQVAAEHDGVASVATEPFTPRGVGDPITGPAYFAAAAGRLQPAVLQLLGATATSRAPRT